MIMQIVATLMPESKPVSLVWIEKLGEQVSGTGRSNTDAVLAPADKIGDRTSTRSSHASVRIEAYSSTLTSAGDARALIGKLIQPFGWKAP